MGCNKDSIKPQEHQMNSQGLTPNACIGSPFFCGILFPLPTTLRLQEHLRPTFIPFRVASGRPSYGPLHRACVISRHTVKRLNMKKPFQHDGTQQFFKCRLADKNWRTFAPPPPPTRCIITILFLNHEQFTVVFAL